MNKRRKSSAGRRGAKRPFSTLAREVQTALTLQEEGNTNAAHQQLLKLAKQHPRNKSVLLALLELSQKLQDWRTYAYYGEQLLHLENREDRADTLNNLVYAYIQLGYPALIWHFATELARQHPNFAHLQQSQTLIHKLEPELRQEAEDLETNLALSPDEKLQLMVLHDRVRFYTESGHPAASIPQAKAFLEKAPGVIAILNNLSLSQFMLGDFAQAIATAESVLAQDPDNFHALGNLVRYSVLTAQFVQAREYAQRLEQCNSDHPDLATKQAEAFAFLGDDEKVQTVYQRALAQGSHLRPLLLHLAAVAAYRLGDEKSAWQLWQKAVNQSLPLEMARSSLAERRVPPGKRNVPWYWPFTYWFPQDMEQLLDKHLGQTAQSKSNRAVEQGMKSMLAERPYFAQLFPHMLEFGDRVTREFVLNFVRVVETPELLQALYDFARSPHGSDDLRLDAIQFISHKHPHLLPENKEVTMWQKGKQSKMFMLNFTITDEPEFLTNVPQEMLEKHEQATTLLLEDRLQEAEQMLQEVIAAAPKFHSAYNHLAAVYEKQGRRQEARALIEETHARFPDYLFARVALARILTQEKRLEEARALLKPILALPELHISEFRALARAQIDITLADNQVDGARSWLAMWRQLEEDNPELLQWQMRIDGPDKLLGDLQKLLGHSQKKKGRR
jgi:tetratricopeptide (TPR) repeat protein